MPAALLEEIRSKLDAGMDPKEIAKLMGKRAGLDFGEMRGIWSAAVHIQQGLAATLRN